MPDLRALAKEILNDGYLISLGFADSEGVWVSDVVYVSDDDLNIYWISKTDTRHSKALERNAAIAGTITAVEKVDAERALQIAGTAEKVEGPLFDLEKKHRAKRGMNMPTEPGEILKEAHYWYKLTPTRIELIHNEHFGWDRQRVL